MIDLTGLVLTPILTVATIFAFFSTLTLVSLFLATRLYICLTQAPSLAEGFSLWMDENRRRLTSALRVQEEGIPIDQGKVGAEVVLSGRENEDGEIELKKVEVQLVENGNGSQFESDFLLREKDVKIIITPDDGQAVDGNGTAKGNMLINGHVNRGVNERKPFMDGISTEKSGAEGKKMYQEIGSR